MDEKVEKLEALKQKILANRELPFRAEATKLVFGSGNPDSPFFFLGEAPGYWEDQQGLPFVGASGKLLDKTLETIGMKRSDIFISNIALYRPPENRDPEPLEIAAYEEYINEMIEIINPSVIVTLGRLSMGKFLPGVKISAIHGVAHPIFWRGKNIIVMPMFHPAAALRGTGVMNQFKDDFAKLTKLLVKAEVEEKKQDSGADTSEQLQLL